MDITILFRACVKTVRTTNKALGVQEPKSNILKGSQKDALLVKPREILKQLTQLQQILRENKAAYLNVQNYLSTDKSMSEFDREQIDIAAENIVSSCSALINDYKKEISGIKTTRQKEEHYQHIIETLDDYLKTVSKIYTEAKAIRVKRVIETHRLSKLEHKSTTTIPKAESSKEQQIPSPEPYKNYDYTTELSSEEMQMFESENDLLYNELHNISDEVKQMESKVVHIAELQELFTEKVLQQEQDIERISATVVNSTDNMKDANEQIRQAIQRNAGLRVWVLFFLLVMSFSLLFLDWYND